MAVSGGCKPSVDVAIRESDLDRSVMPGDDFYRFANGGWLDSHPIPDEFSRYGTFDLLREDNKKLVKELVEQVSAQEAESGSIARKVGDYFKTGMDSAVIDAMGFEPLKPELERIAALENKQQLTAYLTMLYAQGTPTLFYYFGSPDLENSSMVLGNLHQGGMGLTDVDYYRADDERSAGIREEYKRYISRLFTLTGVAAEDADARAARILAFETRLARAAMTRLEQRNPYATFNKMSVDQLGSICPSVDWNAFFEANGVNGATEINVRQPKFIAELDAMLKEIPMAEWKEYLTWNLLNQSTAYLSSDFESASFEFYGKFLSGKEVNQPRWKRVLSSTEGAMGEALGQLFVEKYFPPQAKERMLTLVENLRYALGVRIRNLDWMSEATKEEALAKLATMNVKIGYPDVWRDYSGLEVGESSYYLNHRMAAAFNMAYELSKIGKPVDPNEWGMTPQTVNAYYSPQRNEIVFPAGILQPPFFYFEADDAINYGAIGVVIGHEMTHGFDDQGRQYDKDGNLKDWWTKEDADRFMERAEVLVKQYDSFIVLDTVHADGKLSLGENIADLGGLNIAFTAVKKAWEENSPSELSGFTPEQRFFLAYAHIWANNIRDKEMLRLTKEDVHSLGKFRVNGPLPNLQEFYDAFHLDETNGMYIPVEDRALIW
ncbi:MAG: M13 family metallopeptidase [Bacteroidota bacterium]